MRPSWTLVGNWHAHLVVLFMQPRGFPYVLLINRWPWWKLHLFTQETHVGSFFPFLAFQVPKGAEEYTYIETCIYGHISRWRTGPGLVQRRRRIMGLVITYKLVVRFSGFAPAKLDVGLGK